MYHQINATEMLFHERRRALLEEAESRRLARKLRAGRTPKARGTIGGVAAVALGFLAALALAVGLVAVLDARPAEAAFPGLNGKIVFESDRTTGAGVDNPTGDSEIFTMNPDGTGVAQLTFNTASDINPSFSANGRWIVFTSTRDGNAEIYLMDSNGAGTQFRITNNTTHEDNPTTLDGNKIAYESYRGGDYEIIVLDAAGERNLTDNVAHDVEPTFSPDGSKIAFTSGRDGNSEVYVMNASDGANQTNLTNSAALDSAPAWSPNGQRIAFTSLRNNNFDVYVMNALDGTSQKRLTRKAAFDHRPAWSPDGTKIAFQSNRGDGDLEIYTMKPRPEGEKNRPKNLTKNDDVTDAQPDWQPIVI